MKIGWSVNFSFLQPGEEDVAEKEKKIFRRFSWYFLKMNFYKDTKKKRYICFLGSDFLFKYNLSTFGNALLGMCAYLNYKPKGRTLVLLSFFNDFEMHASTHLYKRMRPLSTTSLVGTQMCHFVKYFSLLPDILPTPGCRKSWRINGVIPSLWCEVIELEIFSHFSNARLRI